MTNDRLELAGAGDGPFVDVVRKHSEAIEAATLSVGLIETDDKLPRPVWTNGMQSGHRVSGRGQRGDDQPTRDRAHGQRAGAATPGRLLSRPATGWLNFGAQANGHKARRFKIEKFCLQVRESLAAAAIYAFGHGPARRSARPRTDGTQRPTPLPLSLEAVRTFQPVSARRWLPSGAARGYCRASARRPSIMSSKKCLRRLFDNRFGFKRCASGEVDSVVVAGFTGDTFYWNYPARRIHALLRKRRLAAAVTQQRTGACMRSTLRRRHAPASRTTLSIFDQVATELRSAGVLG